MTECDIEGCARDAVADIEPDEPSTELRCRRCLECDLDMGFL